MKSHKGRAEPGEVKKIVDEELVREDLTPVTRSSAGGR